jgi:hypothetical protein
MELPNDSDVGALVAKVSTGINAERASRGIKRLGALDIAALFDTDLAGGVLAAHELAGFDCAPYRALYRQYFARQAFNLGRREAYANDGAIMAALAEMGKKFGKPVALGFLKMMNDFEIPLNPHRMTEEQKELGSVMMDALFVAHGIKQGKVNDTA